MRRLEQDRNGHAYSTRRIGEHRHGCKQRKAQHNRHPEFDKNGLVHPSMRKYSEGYWGMDDQHVIETLQERGGSWKDLLLVGNPPVIGRWTSEGNLSALLIQDGVLWRDCVEFLRRHGARSFASPEAAQRALAPTIAPMTTVGSRIWTRAGKALAWLFGLGLVLWPFAAFGAIFIFDSPMQNRNDEVARYTVAYFIWFYPVTYLATYLAYYLLGRRGAWQSVRWFIWGLPVAVFFLLPAVAGWKSAGQANHKRVQLLYRTDHAALLAACREIMASRHSSTHSQASACEAVYPKGPGVPAAILALQPLHIDASEDAVALSLNGEIDSLVVVAYSEQFVNNHTNGFSGNLRLIPGLWFSDRAFSYQETDRAGYIRKLKAMKPDDAPSPKW